MKKVLTHYLEGSSSLYAKFAAGGVRFSAPPVVEADVARRVDMGTVKVNGKDEALGGE